MEKCLESGAIFCPIFEHAARRTCAPLSRVYRGARARRVPGRQTRL